MSVSPKKVSHKRDKDEPQSVESSQLVAWAPAALAHLRLFCRCRLCLVFQCGIQSMPGQRGTLHANWKLLNPGKDHQFSEFVAGFQLNALWSSEHVMKLFKECFHFCPCLAFDAFSHHRGRGTRECTSRALKANIP